MVKLAGLFIGPDCACQRRRPRHHDREEACRQRCRALLLIIRAKLEAVESGITTLEIEFLANILLPDGGTVGQWLSPASPESTASPSRHW